jgi:hypothetical protein
MSGCVDALIMPDESDSFTDLSFEAAAGRAGAVDVD